MNVQRIFALAQRNFILTFRGLDPFIDFFYWPFFDIILWGFTARWMTASNSIDQMLSISLLTSLVLWQAAFRANFDISYSFLSELWSHSLVNLFASPLTKYEWIVSVMILGFFNACIAALFGTFAVWLLYGITIFKVGLLLLPLFFLLLMSGWAIGLLTACVLVYWGQRAEKLVWVMGWIFTPFSGVFFDISALPAWAQKVAYVLPMSYLFSGLRLYMSTGTFPLSYLHTNIVLNILYFSATCILFVYIFERSRIKGLARLEND